MNAEVACLDISSADGDSSSTVCAVGLWDMTAKLVNVKDMTVIHTEELGGGMSYCYADAIVNIKAENSRDFS